MNKHEHYLGLFGIFSRDAEFMRVASNRPDSDRKTRILKSNYPNSRVIELASDSFRIPETRKSLVTGQTLDDFG